jgi:hypothetical protein
MLKLKRKILSCALALSMVAALVPTVAMADDPESLNTTYIEYSLKEGQTIDLYGAYGLSDWSSSDSAIVTLDGTNSISPDSVTATGNALTAPGETVEVTRTYYVRENGTWSTDSQAETFYIAVVSDLADAPEGSTPILLGETITLNASIGFSDWGSVDSTIAKLDGTHTASGVINISPDQISVTGVGSGTTDIIHSYFVQENGEWVMKEEIFRITVVPHTAYTVVYDANGGTGAPTDDTSYYRSVAANEGETNLITVSSQVPTRAGYTFTGWLLRGASRAFSAGQTIDVDSYYDNADVLGNTDDAPANNTLTLVAQWSTPYVPSYNPTPVTPVTPNPGGSGSGSNGGTDLDDGLTDIEDEDTPLAGMVDLTDDHIAYIQGFEGDVRPEASISRQEVATIFYRLLTDLSHALYDSDENDFSDVTADNWSNTAISTLANAGILTGDPEGTFRPAESITRAEFAAVVARFWVMTEDVESPFTDTADHWAEPYIAFVAKYGWVEGYGDDTYRPNQNITRAEVVKIVNRMLNRQVDEEGLLKDYIKFADNTDTTKWYYYEILEASNGHTFDRRTSNSHLENWTTLTETFFD